MFTLITQILKVCNKIRIKYFFFPVIKHTIEKTVQKQKVTDTNLLDYKIYKIKNNRL